MKKPLDWKDLGRFNSILLGLFAIIRDTFVEMKIGIEIVGWLVGEGKKVFVEKYLKPMAAEFLATQRVRVINETTIMVNLDAPPMLPFDGAKIESRTGTGWVQVKKRTDGLYIDSRKVILYLSEQQKNGKTIQGYELREDLSDKPVLHPNILDALFESQHLIPEDWKKDEKGNTRYIFFWAVIFRNADGRPCVRYFFFDGDRWRRYFSWLDHDWRSGCYPAALLAS